MTYNYRQLNSAITIDNLELDIKALNEYLRYINDNFLKVNNTVSKKEVINYLDNNKKLNDKIIEKTYDAINRFKWLCDNKYYSNFLKYYDIKIIINLLYYAYSKGFKYQSYMSALTFYHDYSLKSNDKKVYYEHYEDAIVGLSLYLAKNNPDMAFQFINVLINQEYQPATPTFMNARKKKRGEMVSCFLLDVNDSLNSIMFQISQAAQLSKIGGGVALNLSKLRSRGESIRNIANATKGVVPVLKILENIFNYIDQMGQRKGAGVAYLNIFHYDIKEFLDTKKINSDEKSRIQTLSLGVIIPNKFIELCRDNKDVNLFAPYSVYKTYGIHMDDMDMNQMYDLLSNNPDIVKQSMSARELLNIIAEVQFESGYPFIMFKDIANKYNPLKELESIKMTNLCCFSGDTNIVTKEYNEISFNELIKRNIKKVTIKCAKFNAKTKKWNYRYKKAQVLCTGKKKIIKLLLSNGDIIKCTKDHKLALWDGTYVEAVDSLNKYIEALNNKIKIIFIDYDNDTEEEPVYCLNVKDVNNFVIKGYTGSYLVHNCEVFQAQKLSTINDYNELHDLGYDVNCILGSINIVNVMNNNSIKESVHVAVQLLTQVSELTNLNNAPTVQKSNDLFHSIGLGAMNLHGYLATKSIPYESEEAKDFCNIFFMLLNYYSLEKSMLIAKDKEISFYGFNKSEYKNGNYFNQYIQKDIVPETEKVKDIFRDMFIPTVNDWEDLKNNIQKYGLYHSYRLAIAPTGNISYLQNSTPSVMPVVQNIETRISNDKLVYYPMPFLKQKGVLQYRSAYNMDMYKIIDLISIIQKHIDQGISTTLFINSNYTTRDLQKLYLYAYKKNLKSLYYTRVKNVNIINNECTVCSV